MTAETLKPFIAAGPNYGKTKRNANLITICLASVLSIVCMSLLGFMIWNSIRIAELETEVSSLKRVVDHIHKRLGFDYFDDINEFADAYSNNLLDDVENKDVLDGLEDDLDGDMDPDDLGSGEYEYDDDLYDDEDDEDKINDDFGRFLDEKQSLRRQRSISTNDLRAEKSSEDKDNKLSYKHHINHDSNGRPPIVSHSSVSEKKYFDSPDTTKETTMGHHKIIPQEAAKLNRHGKYRRAFRKADGQGNKFNTERHIERQRRARQRPVAVQFTLKNDAENASLIAIGEPASWAKPVGMDKFFKSNQHQIKISHSGLYYVYAQLSFKTSLFGGFKVYHNSIPFLKCINSMGVAPTDLTCYTSGITYLEKDDNIHLRNAVGVSIEDQSSFIGLVKLGNERVTIDNSLC